MPIFGGNIMNQVENRMKRRILTTVSLSPVPSNQASALRGRRATAGLTRAVRALVLAAVATLGSFPTGSGAALPHRQGPAYRLFCDFSKYLDMTRAHAGEISRVADSVADLFITNGVLYLAPTQDSFLFEQWGRASGLGKAIKWEPGMKRLGQTDLLLLALEPTTDYPGAGDDWLRKAYASQARIILFSSPEDPAAVAKTGTECFAVTDYAGFIDNLTHRQPFTFIAAEEEPPRQVYLCGLMNMLNGLLFQGELAAACTRRGRMPVFWLSFAIDEPKGYPRAARLSRSIAPGRKWGEPVSFHSDLTVPAVRPGYVAAQYLKAMDSYTALLKGRLWSEMDRIVQQTIATLRAGHKVYFLGIGHAFPYEAPRKEWNDVFVMLGPEYSGHMRPFTKNAGAGDMLFLLGMPTYPKREVEDALAKGMSVIVMCTEDPHLTPAQAEQVHWIRAPWPIEDGVVRIPGYDIPILPVTGVMNTLIYYAVRSEVQSRMGNGE